jgi:transposase
LSLVDETRDQTLFELRDQLAERGVQTTHTTLWRFFRRHGITRKKRLPTPRNRIAPIS